MARKRWPLADQLRHLAIEEGEQQRGDMGAVHVGVGHDDDALIAQIVVAVFGAGAAAQRLHQVGQFLVLLQLAGRRRWPRSGSCRAGAGSPGWRGRAPAWRCRRRCRLRPGKSRCPAAASRVQSASLPGRRSLRVAALRLTSFSCRLLEPVLGLIDHEIQQPVGLGRAFRQPVIEMIAHHIFHQALRVGARELVLGLALEFRLADEDRQHGAGRIHHIVGGDQRVLRLLARSPWARSALVSALRRPCSWVPPCGVGMVLQ